MVIWQWPTQTAWGKIRVIHSPFLNTFDIRVCVLYALAVFLSASLSVLLPYLFILCSFSCLFFILVCVFVCLVSSTFLFYHHLSLYSAIWINFLSLLSSHPCHSLDIFLFALKTVVSVFLSFCASSSPASLFICMILGESGSSHLKAWDDEGNIKAKSQLSLWKRYNNTLTL